ncbi:MAG: hypothetical protein EBZ59_07380 [Planctomycetia bacterium]|nr:hypothetical protein [Planctomycetia bacterium]
MSDTMIATNTRTTGHFAPSRLFLDVGGERCAVRAARICPIPEVLGLEEALDIGLAGLAVEAGGPMDDFDGGTVAALLESRMIVPPRPRRRRERALSSRAVFFGGSAG